MLKNHPINSNLIRVSALAFSLVVLLLGGPEVRGMELRQPPKGYAWKEIPDLKAALLVPSGWQFDSESSGNQLQYSISREKKSTQAVASSLTVMARRRVQGDSPPKFIPSQFAHSMFKEIEKNRKLERSQIFREGPFETIRYQYATTPKKGIREYSLLAANDQTGTLYIFTFEATTEQWEKDWDTVSVVLDNLVLDDEI